MKIFNIENGIEKVYVETKDLDILFHIKTKKVPFSVLLKYFLKVKSSNISVTEFIEFKNPSAVDFFKSIDWILNYKLYRSYSDEKLKEVFDFINRKYSDILNSFNYKDYVLKIPFEESSKYYAFLKIRCIYNSLFEMFSERKGEHKISYPQVPDSDDEEHSYGDEYITRLGIDPRKLFLYRRDGKCFSDNEEIPYGFEKVNEFMATREIIKRFDNFNIKNDKTDLIGEIFTKLEKKLSSKGKKK